MLFVGDDWAEDHHDVEIVDEDGRRLAARRVPEGPGGIAALHALMACAEALQVLLDHDCEVEIWNQGSFGLSGTNLESLVAAANRFHFAIPVVTADDTKITRGKIRAEAFRRPGRPARRSHSAEVADDK